MSVAYYAMSGSRRLVVPAELSAPDLLSTVSQQNTNSIVSGSISANSGDLILVIVQTREDAAATHGVPTTTLSNMNDFGSSVYFTGLTPHGDDNATLWLDTTIFWGYATDDTGSGTITCGVTGSGTVAFAVLTVLRFAAGWDATPIGTTGTGEDASAGTSPVSFGSAPAASSCGVLTLSEATSDSDGTPPTDFTELVDINLASSFHCMVVAKLNPGQGPHTFTALGSPAVRSLYAVEIEESA